MTYSPDAASGRHRAGGDCALTGPALFDFASMGAIGSLEGGKRCEAYRDALEALRSCGRRCLHAMVAAFKAAPAPR